MHSLLGCTTYRHRVVTAICAATFCLSIISCSFSCVSVNEPADKRVRADVPLQSKAYSDKSHQSSPQLLWTMLDNQAEHNDRKHAAFILLSERDPGRQLAIDYLVKILYSSKDPLETIGIGSVLDKNKLSKKDVLEALFRQRDERAFQKGMSMLPERNDEPLLLSMVRDEISRLRKRQKALQEMVQLYEQAQ